MKAKTRVLVIGGGIAGCSTLYHLTRLGWQDVSLVERGELTSGSTWHAAGNLPHYSASLNVIKLQAYSIELYARLEEETGQQVGYHRTGSIRLAHSQQRMDEYRRVCGTATLAGVDFRLLSPEEIRELYPFLSTHEIVGGLYDPGDGHIDPSSVTQAMAKGAREHGATIYRNCPVQAIRRTPDGNWEVHTPDGIISAEILVNAAGFRAGEIAAMVGHNLPMVSVEHQYVVTESVPALEQREGELPLLRDPDVSYYLRQERKGFILGPYEPECRAWAVNGVPPAFGQELLPPDLDRLESLLEDAMRRVPILADGGVKTVVNGPITYAPDGGPLIGPAYGVDNYFLCTAFSFGIVQGGGAGKFTAQWIVNGHPELDLIELDPTRFGAYANRRHAVAKARETYRKEYTIVFPYEYENRPAARRARMSPIYDRLAAHGAVFGTRFGWERANWFTTDAKEGRDELSFRRGNWFEPVAAECRTVRERVGVLDLSAFAKFEVYGPGAEQFLNHVCANHAPRRNGAIVLAHALTENGGVACEFTITRLSEERFYLVSAAAAEHHDHDWLRRRLPNDGSVRLERITTAYGTLVLAGPRSRQVLQKLTDADLSNERFPWLTAQEIDVGPVSLRALRVNYVGELGWELHHPIEQQCPLYDELMAAGEECGIADFGLRAMDSMRLEKAYRMWGTDLTTEFSALEAGMDRFVKLDGRGFIGEQALQRQKRDGLQYSLVCLEVDAADADAFGFEPIFQDDRLVGSVTSAGYGHLAERSLAIGYVESAAATPGTGLRIQILGERRAATVLPAPVYDPNNERLRS